MNYAYRSNAISSDDEASRGSSWPDFLKLRYALRLLSFPSAEGARGEEGKGKDAIPSKWFSKTPMSAGVPFIPNRADHSGSLDAGPVARGGSHASPE